MSSTYNVFCGRDEKKRRSFVRGYLRSECQLNDKSGREQQCLAIMRRLSDGRRRKLHLLPLVYWLEQHSHSLRLWNILKLWGYDNDLQKSGTGALGYRCGCEKMRQSYHILVFVKIMWDLEKCFSAVTRRKTRGQKIQHQLQLFSGPLVVQRSTSAYITQLRCRCDPTPRIIAAKTLKTLYSWKNQEQRGGLLSAAFKTPC